MVLDVGAPLGWGPLGLTPPQLEACLQAITAAVNPLQVGPGWRGARRVCNGVEGFRGEGRGTRGGADEGGGGVEAEAPTLPET